MIDKEGVEGLELDKWKDGIKYDVVSKCFVHDLVYRPTQEEIDLRKRAEAWEASKESKND